MIITPNPPLFVKERVIKEIFCPNEKCNAPIDITDKKGITKIQCPVCGNVTWVPKQNENKLKNTMFYTISLIITFIIGFLSSLLASVHPRIGTVKMLQSQ